MVIDPTSAHRFIKHYQDFLLSIADREESQGQTPLMVLALARRRYLADRNLFTAWRAENEQRDTDVLDAIASIDIGQWIYLKDTRCYSAFLRADGEAAYAVHGLTDRLRNISGCSGLILNCGVFQLGRQYVCDGILENVAVLGSNYMASFKETYQSLRQQGRFYSEPGEGAGKDIGR